MRKTRAAEDTSPPAAPSSVKAAPPERKQEEEPTQFVPIAPRGAALGCPRVGVRRLGRWNPPARLFEK